LKIVVPAFEELTKSVEDSPWVKEWEKLEAKAMKIRGEAMMIYNVSPVQGILGSITWVRLNLANL